MGKFYTVRFVRGLFCPHTMSVSLTGVARATLHRSQTRGIPATLTASFASRFAALVDVPGKLDPLEPVTGSA